jgi:hypothetical protein
MCHVMSTRSAALAEAWCVPQGQFKRHICRPACGLAGESCTSRISSTLSTHTASASAAANVSHTHATAAAHHSVHPASPTTTACSALQAGSPPCPHVACCRAPHTHACRATPAYTHTRRQLPLNPSTAASALLLQCVTQPAACVCCRPAHARAARPHTPPPPAVKRLSSQSDGGGVEKHQFG